MRLKTLFFILTATVFTVFLPDNSSASACKYKAEVMTAAEKAGLPPTIVVAIMMAESSCDSKKVDETGKARGLFQFEKETWERFSSLPFAKAFDPHENIKTAIKYLKAAKTIDPKGLASWHNAGTKRWWKLAKKWSVNHPNKIYRKIYRGEIT